MTRMPLGWIAFALVGCASSTESADVSIRRTCGAVASFDISRTFVEAKAPLLEVRMGVSKQLDFVGTNGLRTTTLIRSVCEADLVVARVSLRGLDVSRAGQSVVVPLDKTTLDNWHAANRNSDGCWVTVVCDDLNGDGACTARDTDPPVGGAFGLVTPIGGSLPPLRLQLQVSDLPDPSPSVCEGRYENAGDRLGPGQEVRSGSYF